MNGLIAWDEPQLRGGTKAGHVVAILRKSNIFVAAVKMPDGGTLKEIYRSAFDVADARVQAEELVQWPIN
jgi:hypothetical protein